MSIIIIRTEEGKTFEMFDTTKEFKQHVNSFLISMEIGMREDDLLEEDTLFGVSLEKVSFHDKLDMYLETNCFTLEVK